MSSATSEKYSETALGEYLILNEVYNIPCSQSREHKVKPAALQKDKPQGTLKIDSPWKDYEFSIS